MKVESIRAGSIFYRIFIGLFAKMTILWMKTLRLEVIDPHGFNTTPDGARIAVFWHNRILGSPPLFNEALRHKCFAMASRSKDGQAIVDYLSHLGIRAIRGSSNKKGKNKGGAAALREFIKVLENGDIACLIPDGPRGPMYEPQPGALLAALKTQAPLVPISANFKRYITIPTWDKLQLPLPFTKATLIFGDPIKIDRSMTREEQVTALKEALMKITVD